MDKQSPLPPEPVTGAGGYSIGLLFLLVFLVAVAAGLMALWGYGTTEMLLKIIVTMLTGTVTLAVVIMAFSRRR